MVKKNEDTDAHNSLSIVFIGNCGFYLSDGIQKLYIDFPYKSGAFGYMEFDKHYLDSLDYYQDYSFFLFTHGHADHFSRKEVRSRKLKVTGPFWVRLISNNSLTIDSLNKVGNWKVTPYKTKHSWSFQHFSYLVEWKTQSIFITGDAENIGVLDEVDNIDVLITNPWFLEDAIKSNKIKEIKKIILCHLRPETKVKINDQMQKKVIVPNQGMTIILNSR